MLHNERAYLPASFFITFVLLALGVGLSGVLIAADSIRVAPGDQKIGYHSADYITDSLSLELRQGQAMDLVAHAQKKHLGLPLLSEFQDRKPERLKVELGRKLFYDRRLSLNKTMSCAMCHIPEHGFSNNELKRPIGFEGRSIKRNAPTLLNVAFNRRLFADARETSLAHQVWSPLLASNEMNNPSVGYVIDQIHSDQAYSSLFDQAFGEPANMLNIGEALAHYEQVLIAGNSRFDQWFYAGDASALKQQEQDGFELFRGKGGCNICHTVGSDTALFTDHALHNTGVGYQVSMLPSADSHSTKPSPNNNIRVQLAPGVYGQVAKHIVQQVSEKKSNDLGRYEVTLDPNDRWRFRTPSLRNVALTAPYMHNGEFLTLESVIEFYNNGGVPHELLSPLIRPLGLNNQEQAALVAFLKTLTGDNVDQLVADAFVAPVGDPISQEGLREKFNNDNEE